MKAIEIRFHGRGGQGAKTAAVMLAEAFIMQGRHAQAFPEFGPERRGAPVKSFVRASDSEITTHEPVIHPDYVVVIDESLMDLPEITEGISSEGILLVNSAHNPDFFKRKFDGKIYTIDATKIAMDILEKNFSNTVMLGALAGLAGISLESLKQVAYGHFKEKGEKTAEGNVRVMEIAFESIKNEK